MYPHMPMIVWVLVAIAGGLFAGFTLPWQIGLGMCGVLAWLAASDFIPSATVLYFAAAFALSISGPKPLAGASVIVRPDSTQLGERMRLRAAHTIDLAFGSDAPTARALLVADQSEIPRDVKRAYTDAGIVHMLAISGLHVSIVAASLALMLNLFRVPARIASFATAGIIMGYVFVLGFPAPALASRCNGMRCHRMPCVPAAHLAVEYSRCRRYRSTHEAGNRA